MNRKELPDFAAPACSETLLIVDDDKAVLQFLNRLFSRCGYKVLAAPDGWEALRVYLENQQKVRLVLLDLLMPEIDGQHLLQTLLRMNPGLSILVLSAAAPESKEAALRMGALHVVEKPFDPKTLLQTVRGILETPEAALR